MQLQYHSGHPEALSSQFSACALGELVALNNQAEEGLKACEQFSYPSWQCSLRGYFMKQASKQMIPKTNKKPNPEKQVH